MVFTPPAYRRSASMPPEPQTRSMPTTPIGRPPPPPSCPPPPIPQGQQGPRGGHPPPLDRNPTQEGKESAPQATTSDPVVTKVAQPSEKPTPSPASGPSSEPKAAVQTPSLPAPLPTTNVDDSSKMDRGARSPIPKEATGRRMSRGSSCPRPAPERFAERAPERNLERMPPRIAEGNPFGSMPQRFPHKAPGDSSDIGMSRTQRRIMGGRRGGSAGEGMPLDRRAESMYDRHPDRRPPMPRFDGSSRVELDGFPHRPPLARSDRHPPNATTPRMSRSTTPKAASIAKSEDIDPAALARNMAEGIFETLSGAGSSTQAVTLTDFSNFKFNPTVSLRAPTYNDDDDRFSNDGSSVSSVSLLNERDASDQIKSQNPGRRASTAPAAARQINNPQNGDSGRKSPIDAVKEQLVDLEAGVTEVIPLKAQKSWCMFIFQAFLKVILVGLVFSATCGIVGGWLYLFHELKKL